MIKTEFSLIVKPGVKMIIYYKYEKILNWDVTACSIGAKLYRIYKARI